MASPLQEGTPHPQKFQEKAGPMAATRPPQPGLSPPRPAFRAAPGQAHPSPREEGREPGGSVTASRPPRPLSPFLGLSPGSWEVVLFTHSVSAQEKRHLFFLLPQTPERLAMAPLPSPSLFKISHFVHRGFFLVSILIVSNIALKYYLSWLLSVWCPLKFCTQWGASFSSS